MTKKVTVINRKGGACKTTTAVNIAAALGLKGYKVLAIDLDPQADLTAYLLPNDLSGFNTLTDGFDKQDLSICIYPSTAENVD
jgi:chromosome partitioning protein